MARSTLGKYDGAANTRGDHRLGPVLTLPVIPAAPPLAFVVNPVHLKGLKE